MCGCTYLKMASSGKSTGDSCPHQTKPPPWQMALVSTDKFLGKKRNRENDHSKTALPLTLGARWQGTKGHSLRTVGHSGSGVLEDLLPRQAVELAKVLSPGSSSTVPTLPCYSFLYLLCFLVFPSYFFRNFLRGEVAVAGPVHLEQTLGLALPEASHSRLSLLNLYNLGVRKNCASIPDSQVFPWKLGKLWIIQREFLMLVGE